MMISNTCGSEAKNIQKSSAKEILTRALRRDAAIGTDNVAKAFIQIKTENGQNLHKDDVAKEPEKEYLEEPDGNRQCSLWITLREV